MTKQELKILIKDTIQYKKENCLEGEYLTITTNDTTYYVNEFDELTSDKIRLNDIQVAMFKNGYAHSIYLKNGLKSYRIAKQNNLI